MSVRALVLLVGALVVAIVAGVALASTTVKKFDAKIEQTSATTFKLTLTNDLSSNQSFGSANVEIPTGFSNPSGFVQTVAGGTKQWRAPVLNTSVTPRTIELRSLDVRNQLAPGQELTLVFTATAPCSAQPYEFKTYVKQSNDFRGTGNDFVGPIPTVSVTGGLAGFDITDIPDPQAVGRSFPVNVEAKDACGNRATGYQGPATLSGLTGVSASSLSFTSGLASTSLTPVTSQLDAQLTVADGSVSDVSNEFDVVDVLCTSENLDEGERCEADDGFGTRVSAPRPEGDATLAISFSGRGSSSMCGTGDIVGSRITIDPQGYEAATPVTFTWPNTFPPGTGVPHYTLCWDDGKNGPRPLDPCAKQMPEPTCELKRNRTGVADLQIVVLLAPFDPIFDLG